MASTQYPIQHAAAAAGLCLLLFFAVRSDSRPSDHETDPAVASPAMLAFFGAQTAGAQPAVALPEASNATDPAWAAAGKAGTGRAAPEWTGDEGRGRTAVQMAGVICGVIGAAMLAVAAAGFVIHARRSEGTGFGLGALMGRREVRLGSVC